MTKDHIAAPANSKNNAYSWYMVFLLTLIYVFSFIDRFILGLLIEPIKAELNLSDLQVGILLGPSFALFYALMGLPLGWLADKKRRTFIIGLGLALWSLATAASGLARNFLHLFLARMSVGVGEATLSPCAMSLIADSFPKEKRGKPIAFYSMAISLGAGIAYIAGAAVISWANTSPSVSLFGFADLSAWRLSLLIVGLPGLLLVPLVLLLREPKRTQDTLTNSEDNYKAVFAHIAKHWPTFLGFVSVFGYIILIGYSTTWGAATFSRTWGWSPIQFGQALGTLFIVFGPLSINLGGWLSDKLYQRGNHTAPMLVGLIGIPITTLGAIAWPLMPSATLALLPLSLLVIGTALSSATGVTALLNIIPSNIRGRTIAVYYMATSLFGIGVGPVAIGLLNDSVFGPENLRISMALLPVIFGLPLMFFMPKTLKSYQRLYDRLN